MTCTACGKRVEGIFPALELSTCVGGAIAAETTLIAGMLFTPLAIFGLLGIIWWSMGRMEYCECRA
jgi:hypothetical protein